MSRQPSGHPVRPERPRGCPRGHPQQHDSRLVRSDTVTTSSGTSHPHSGPAPRRVARPLRPPRCPRSRRAGPLPGKHINGGEDCEDPVERGRRMVRATVRLRAAAIGRSGRRKRGRGDQPRRAPIRYPRLRQPDGTRVRRPPQAAAERMRWICQLAAETAAPATCEPGPEVARVAGSPATTLVNGPQTWRLTEER
jgi:hypothetical protein